MPPKAERSRTHFGNDTGAATIWVLAASMLVLFVASAVMVSAEARAARHRTQEIADLAALAAAHSIGTERNTCAAAGAVVEANGATLVACVPNLEPGRRSGDVRIAIERQVALPVLGRQTSAAHARAGRLPP